MPHEYNSEAALNEAANSARQKKIDDLLMQVEQAQREGAVNSNGTQPCTAFRQAMIDAERIATALNGKRSGNKWMAQCPAHDDRKPSLSIRDGDNGVLVHCFAGCSQTAVIDALRSRGLWHSATPEQRRVAKQHQHEAKRNHANVVAVIAEADIQHSKAGEWNEEDRQVYEDAHAIRPQIDHELGFDTVPVGETDWAEPQPLPEGLPAVPAFDSVLLPETLRPWVEDIAERIQCPPECPASGAMVALAAVVGRQVGIRPRLHDDWTVVPNLWGAVVGRPGLLKSPALAEVMRPLHWLEACAKENYETERRDHEADRLVGKAAAKDTERQIGKAIKDDDTARAHELATAAMADEAETPRRRRYVTSDTTVEALGELLAANPRGVLLFRDELTGF